MLGTVLGILHGNFKKLQNDVNTTPEIIVQEAAIELEKTFIIRQQQLGLSDEEMFQHDIDLLEKLAKKCEKYTWIDPSAKQIFKNYK
jgi:hypothetical protein